MAGTILGGKKAAITTKEIHGEGFYREIGAIGGRNGHTGGFFANRELAREAGRKGGRISRRGTKAAELRAKMVKLSEASQERIHAIRGGAVNAN